MVPLLLAAMAIADPGSLVPAGADWALVAPHAGTGASEASALLSVAGAKAPLLGPASLGGAWAHELALNPFDPASLSDAGVAADAPLAAVALGKVDLLTFGSGDAARVKTHFEAWLAGLGGIVSSEKRGKLALRICKLGGQIVAAWAEQGGRVAAARAGPRGGDAAAAVQSALGGKKTLASLPQWKALAPGAASWRVWVQSSRGAGPIVAALSRRGASELVAAGRIRLQSPDVLPRSLSPAPVPEVPGALGVVRMRLSGGAPLASALSWLVGQACPACDAAMQQRAGSALSALAAGPAVLAIDNADLHALAGGRPTASAFPTVWALPVSDAARAAAVAGEIARKLGASQGEGSSWSAPAQGGRVFFGVDRGLVYLATDPGARDRDLPALAAAGSAGPESPLVAILHPQALGRALASVSVLDALGGGALAGLFAAKVEVGAFLDAAGPIEIHARPAGPSLYAFDLSWKVSRQ